MKFSIVSKDQCPWCDKVKALLLEEGHEVEVWEPDLPTLRRVLKLHNVTTVPQVFCAGERLGGYEDTKRHLERLRSPTHEQ